MEAQRKRAREMMIPRIRERVRDYYYKFRFLQEVIEETKINNNSKILDIGCGIKTVLHFLPGALRIGIDPLAGEYKKIYDYPPDLIIKKSSGEKLEYQDNFFDVVFITNVLDHTSNPKKVVSEAYRVLRQGGYLSLTNELVKKETKRDRAHPHNLGEDDILNLLVGKFNIILKKYSPWIGIRQYYLDQIDLNNVNLNNNQITILAQKK